jgi:hypothetical protein
MDNLREDVEAMFDGQSVIDPYIDPEGFLVATEQNLFSDDDEVGKTQRTMPVDEDMLAAFVELQLKIRDKQEQLEFMDKLIKKIQARLDLAQTDPTQRLSKELYGQCLTKLVELIGSKKQNKVGKKQAVYSEIRELSAQRSSISDRDHNGIWAAWFQLEDPDQFLADYLEKPFLDFFDPKDIDQQHLISSEEDAINTMDCLADEHVRDMTRGEGLAWQDERVPTDKFISGNWYNMKNEWKINQEAIRNNQEEEIFQSLLIEF